MKTAPTLRVVSNSDAQAELGESGVIDLPTEVRLALTDIAGAAREGLLALSWPPWSTSTGLIIAGFTRPAGHRQPAEYEAVDYDQHNVPVAPAGAQ